MPTNATNKQPNKFTGFAYVFDTSSRGTPQEIPKLKPQLQAPAPAQRITLLQSRAHPV
jgi:hypothetical protein